MDYTTIRWLIIAALIVVPVGMGLFAWAMVYVGARGEREFADRIDVEIQRKNYGDRMDEIAREAK